MVRCRGVATELLARGVDTCGVAYGGGRGRGRYGGGRVGSSGNSREALEENPLLRELLVLVGQRPKQQLAQKAAEEATERPSEKENVIAEEGEEELYTRCSQLSRFRDGEWKEQSSSISWCSP